MLTTLRIKNLALVSDLTLELQPGYNAITGETGAGKSIIIGGLNLVLGERADRTLIRSGADSCSVEAVFDLPAIRPALTTLLEENGIEPCEGAQLVLKRTFTAAGTNRQFVNGSPTTLALLAAVGQWLVDMHGPHDHQSLLHPARQLAILDAFAGLVAPREHFTQLVRRRAALAAEKSALIIDERTYAQQLELLRHQATEIAAAKLHPDEEAALAQEFHRASNSARLLQLAQSAINLLGEDDNSLLTQLGAVGRLLQEIHRIDSAAAPLAQLQESAAARRFRSSPNPPRASSPTSAFNKAISMSRSRPSRPRNSPALNSSPRCPASTPLNFNSRPTPANPRARCAPSRPPAKWRA